jgi:EAL domain-containing protein (putative c-di-GMP-specific phosphodiesterase class I)/GGDEF domain-containing protein
MEVGPGPSTGWRGWASPDSAAGGPVTSARLGQAARPRSRLFPKTRSWFALDAPLELLSPLSVLRVLFALATVAWPLLCLPTSSSHLRMVLVLVVCTGTAILWAGLLMVRKVDLHGSRLLLGYWTAATGVLVWSVAGGPAVVALVLLLVPGVVFAALCLGRRAVVVHQVGTAVILWVALTPHDGVLRALLVAVVAAASLAMAATAVLLLDRAARRHATVDPDTGLPNGFGLAQRLAADDPSTYLVAAVVIDGIGGAREALGYQVGTELVRRAVEDLGQVLPSEAVIGRVDGDELVVTLVLEDPHPDPDPGADGDSEPVGEEGAGPPTAVVQAGRSLADTLVGAIDAGRYQVGGLEVPLRAHAGLATAPWDGTSVAELVRRASLSARRAVDAGVPVVVWNGEQGALTAEDLILVSRLRTAAERGELSLAYQPQVARGSRAIRSVEALLRWNRRDLGDVSPGRFIPLAERTGLITGITEWVIVEALDAQMRWRAQGIDLPVSVNLSAKSLPAPELSAWILDQLDQRGLPPSCLTVEVTETAVADPAQAVVMLRPLHQRGVRISIDDFGTGFTSLAALPTLPLDELKVDQCFVLRSLESPADAAIVHTVGELAHRLGLHAVAEGVETAAIADLVEACGIDLLQGYHFARPLRERDLLGYVREHPTAGPTAGPTAAGSAPVATGAAPPDGGHRPHTTV